MFGGDRSRNGGNFSSFYTSPPASSFILLCSVLSYPARSRGSVHTSRDYAKSMTGCVDSPLDSSVRLIAAKCSNCAEMAEHGCMFCFPHCAAQGLAVEKALLLEKSLIEVFSDILHFKFLNTNTTNNSLPIIGPLNRT